MAGRLATPLARIRVDPPWCHHGQKTWFRGKKKNAKARSSLYARLLVDMPAYGRKGSIVPIPVGQMRNHFFPKRMANYLSLSDSGRLRQGGIPVERDVNFMRDVPPSSTTTTTTTTTSSPEPRAGPSLSDSPSHQAAPAASSSQGAMSQLPVIEVGLLPAEDAYELLADGIPSTLDFYRTPIGPTILPQPETTLLDDDTPPGISPHQGPDNIYGSVSPADIGAAIRSLLHSRGSSGLVLLPDENISIISATDLRNRVDRIKKLGEYEYEIRVRGFSNPLHRKVRVLSDSSSESSHGAPSTGPGTSIV